MVSKVLWIRKERKEGDAQDTGNTNIASSNANGKELELRETLKKGNDSDAGKHGEWDTRVKVMELQAGRFRVKVKQKIPQQVV